MKILPRSLLLAMVLSCGATSLLSDALVITRAMLASTIAEIFVEQDSVVVELEIGAQDLEAFRNLLPDELYERMGYEPEPWIDRLQRFVAEDFVVRDERGRSLFGYLRSIEPRDRTKRDEVTGEPVPVAPGEEEPVVFARLAYPTGGRPPRLSFSPPGSAHGVATANIGFVTYHHTLPINDFRYLGVEETLTLDWEDPWFSQFENRNLRRQFFAPISAFLYVEPYEVRKEVVLRPKDLQQWVDLGLTGRDTIRVVHLPQPAHQRGDRPAAGHGRHHRHAGGDLYVPGEWAAGLRSDDVGAVQRTHPHGPQRGHRRGRLLALHPEPGG
jgi:hypothetical protein